MRPLWGVLPSAKRPEGQATSGKGAARACQTLSGPLPRSGSPAREARGAATAAPTIECESGPQRQASAREAMTEAYKHTNFAQGAEQVQCTRS